MLELSGIKENIEIEVRDNQIVITAATKPRVGWNDAFGRLLLAQTLRYRQRH